MPWTAPGVKPNRTWVYAPSVPILTARWNELVQEQDTTRKAVLFKDSRDSTLDKEKDPLPGPGTHRSTGKLRTESGPMPAPVRVGYRSFDRQWIIPDARLLDQARPHLWAARRTGQVFVVEQNTKPVESGPGLVFSALIPDMDHFKGSEGGRALPMLHPDGSPNLAPGLLDALATLLGQRPNPTDVTAYVAALVAHPAFTATFADELTTPGIRVPITTEPDLWAEAVDLGRQVVWLHTYGEAFTDESLDRPRGTIRYPRGDVRQPLARAAVTGMPESISYDETRQVVRAGTGEWGPVIPPCGPTPSAART